MISSIDILPDDTTLCSKFDQATDMCSQSKLASELEPELQDTVDWGRKWLVPLTGLITLVLGSFTKYKIMSNGKYILLKNG